jgi:predicted nuclease of predicted toxin-antitoxin system
VRLILDENFPKAAVDLLRSQGHDVLWIRTHAPGMKDKVVLQLAAREERVVLTLDKDFRHLSFAGPLTGNYGVILFRVRPAVPDKIIPVVLKALGLRLSWLGYVSVVSETAVQMHPLRII